MDAPAALTRWTIRALRLVRAAGERAALRANIEKRLQGKIRASGKDPRCGRRALRQLLKIEE